MVIASPATVPYEAFQHEREKRIKAERERDTYKNELFLLRKLRRAPVLKPVGKAVLEEFRHVEKWGTVKAPDGSTRANYTTIAKNLNTSPDTVARQAERLEKLGLVEIHEHQGPKDEGDRKYVHVKEEKLASIEQLEDPEEIMPKQGGNRYVCQKCGSTRVAKRTVTSLKCLEAECGHESIIRDSGWIEQNVQEAQKQHAFDDSTLADDDTEDDQKQNAEHCVYTLPYDEQVADNTDQKQVASDVSARSTSLPNEKQVASDVSAFYARYPDILVELKSRRIWACWRWELDDKGKLTKVPYIADLSGTRRASNTEAGTWRTYDYAVACYEQSQSWDRSETSKRKPFDGIGFMCDSTFTFMDQDHCRNPETGEITQEAMERARAINSYTEPSVSGDGLHTYAWGNLPVGRRRDSARGIELYDRARFCVFTGQPLPDFPQTMEKREEELLALHSQLFPERPGPDLGPLWNDDTPCSLPEEEILEKARSARNGAKFSALFNGEWQKYYSSQSEADLGLCRMIAHWCDKSVSTIDSLFRKSGLYRPKWEREDYRASTLKLAIG